MHVQLGEPGMPVGDERVAVHRGSKSPGQADGQPGVATETDDGPGTATEHPARAARQCPHRLSRCGDMISTELLGDPGFRTAGELARDHADYRLRCWRLPFQFSEDRPDPGEQFAGPVADQDDPVAHRPEPRIRLMPRWLPALTS